MKMKSPIKPSTILKFPRSWYSLLPGEAAPFPSTHVDIPYECKVDLEENQFISMDNSVRAVAEKLDESRPRDGKDYVFARRYFSTYSWRLLKQGITAHRLHHIEGFWVQREVLSAEELGRVDEGLGFNAGATVQDLGNQIYFVPSPPQVECEHCEGRGWRHT